MIEEKTRVPNKLGWVYFVGCGDVVKIGFTSVVTQRLKELQTGSHTRLVLLAQVRGTRQMERRYHKGFANYRVRGEWFRLSGHVRREIDRLNGAGKREKIVPHRTVDVSKDVGRLAALRDAHKDNAAIWNRLCIGIGQLREWASAPYEQKLALVPLMKQTRKGLRDLGVEI